MLPEVVFAFNSGEFMKQKCSDSVFKSYGTDAVQCLESCPITSRNGNGCHILVTSHTWDGAH